MKFPLFFAFSYLFTTRNAVYKNIVAILSASLVQLELDLCNTTCIAKLNVYAIENKFLSKQFETNEFIHALN